MEINNEAKRKIWEKKRRKNLLRKSDAFTQVNLALSIIFLYELINPFVDES